MKVVIASEQHATRSGVGMLIDAQPDLEWVGDVSGFYDLLVLIKSNEPDLIILDWDCFGRQFATFQELMKLFPKPPQVVALSVNDQLHDEAFAAGVTQFAHKGSPPADLLDAIRQIRSASGPRDIIQSIERDTP